MTVTSPADSLARAKHRRLSALAGALIGIAWFAGACGGGSKRPSVASIGSTPPTTAAAPAAPSGVGPGNLQQAYQSQLEYSQCMRTHGEPSFPDPVLSAQSIRLSLHGIDPNSSQFIAANTACKKLVPNGGPPSAAQRQQLIAAALKNSECMRAHGVPNFPDPNVSGGGITIRIGGPGVNPSSPQFQGAEKTCQKLAPLAAPG